jgi:mannose-6-phosphate isomerase-like protein (cupin superfamily)
MIQKIIHKDELLAIVIRAGYQNNGIEFFTPDSYSQQLAFMSHPSGKIIAPHLHNPIRREVFLTKEVLFIRKGKLRVDFYSCEKQYLESLILSEGDLILLASGGHGFEALEDLEMYEVKQGPYAGEKDKVRFDAIDKKLLKIKNT